MSTAVAVRPSSHESPLPSRETPASERHSHQPRSGSSPRSYVPPVAWSAAGSGNGSGREVQQHQYPQTQMPSSSPSPSRLLPHGANLVTPQSQRHGGDGRAGGPQQPETTPQRNNSYGPNIHNPPSSSEKSSKPSYAPIIKKERATSPDASSQHSGGGGTPSSSGRHRPRRLDLSNNTPIPQGARSAKQTAPLTAKESAGLSAMQDVGLACLSPGFTTDNPDTQRLLEKSMDVREQQRRIIESRLNKGGGKDGEASSSKGPLAGGPPSATFSRPLATTRRKGPPPGLSITAPSAQQFASEPRVIQSAPLHQSFTGLNKPGSSSSNAHPLSRQVLEHSHHQQYAHAQSPVAPTAGSSAHYAQPPQTALPSISNMFPHESSIVSPAQRPAEGPSAVSRRNSGGSLHAPISSAHPALPSPGFPPGHSSSLHPPPQRHQEREFRSAEEAVHSMAGGREDLLPKIVHYGGHQPPTPPSPLPPGHPNATQQTHHASQAQQQGQTHASHPQYAPYQSSGYSASSASYRNEPQGNAPRSSSSRRRTREEYEQDTDRMDVDARTADERERRRGPMFDWAAERERERDARDREGKYAEYGRIGGVPAQQPPPQPQQQQQPLAPAAATGVSSSRSELKEPLQPAEGEFRDREAAATTTTTTTTTATATATAASEVQRRKKAEFMELCARAWDLLHS